MHFSIFLQWHFKILKLAVLCILVYFCSGCRIKKLSDQSQMFTAPLTNILPCANTCCVSHCSCRCRQEVGHIVAVCHIAVADVVKKWAIILSTYLPVFSRTCVCNICWPTKVGKVLLVVCHRHYNNFHTKSSPNNANITLIIQEHFSKSKNKTKTDVHSLEKIKGKTWQKNVFSDDA